MIFVEKCERIFEDVERCSLEGSSVPAKEAMTASVASMIDPYNCIRRRLSLEYMHNGSSSAFTPIDGASHVTAACAGGPPDQ